MFVIGVTIWPCEGRRKRPYEVEVSNSRDVVTKLFVELLKALGLAEDVKLRLHVPLDGYEKFEKYWRRTLELDNFVKPIVTKGHKREVGNGIVHIKIYSAIARELFKYWAESLPKLLQTPKGREFKSLPAHFSIFPVH